MAFLEPRYDAYTAVCLKIEPFDRIGLYRLERSRTTPGSGFRLSLVKAIADMHNVDLTLTDNQPGLRVSLTFDSIMQSPNK